MNPQNSFADFRGHFILNALSLCRQYNRNWLSRLIDKKWIRCVGSTPNNREGFKTSLFRLIDIYVDTYGDNVEFSIYYDLDLGSFTPVFIIRYKSFYIKNSNEAKHLIKELLVVQTFTQTEKGFLTPNGISGTRLAKTIPEIVSGYRQSHLTSHSQANFLQTPLELSKFCLGSSDISMMISDFQWQDAMDYERFELYLYAVDATVKWESLEGVPHFRIANIGVRRVETINEHHGNKVVQEIISNKVPLDFDFYIADKFYKIKANKRASEFINKILEFTSGITKADILVTFNPFLKVYNRALTLSAIKDYEKNISFSYEEDETPFILFRGQKLQPRILKENGFVETKPEDLIVHPKFLEYVIKQLECRIFEKNVALSATKIINSRRNAFRGLTPDQISV